MAQENTVPMVDAPAMREVLGRFCTGVVIVAATTDAGPVGFTAQSFVSLSLDPPLVCLCVAKSSSSYPHIQEVGAFSVNVLRSQQQDLSAAFATKRADRFDGVAWRSAPVTGSPLLDDCLAWVDCTVEAEHEAGDHLIVIGRVQDLGSCTEDEPLLYFAGSYHRLEGVSA